MTKIYCISLLIVNLLFRHSVGDDNLEEADRPLFYVTND
jgi:hypothetical protein